MPAPRKQDNVEHLLEQLIAEIKELKAILLVHTPEHLLRKLANQKSSKQ